MGAFEKEYINHNWILEITTVLDPSGRFFKTNSLGFFGPDEYIELFFAYREHVYAVGFTKDHFLLSQKTPKTGISSFICLIKCPKGNLLSILRTTQNKRTKII